MKRWTWPAIRTELGALRPAARMPEPAAFWTDFKARARLRPQQRPEPARAVFAISRWAIAGACATILVCWLGFHAAHGSNGQGLSVIRTLEVDAAHSGVLIMTDEPGQSMILWILDMQTGERNGGG